MLLTRLPLSPKGSFDLHVLSLPPAFVLSQDQTLKFDKLTYSRSTQMHIDEDTHHPILPHDRTERVYLLEKRAPIKQQVLTIQ